MVTFALDCPFQVPAPSFSRSASLPFSFSVCSLLASATRHASASWCA